MLASCVITMGTLQRCVVTINHPICFWPRPLSSSQFAPCTDQLEQGLFHGRARSICQDVNGEAVGLISVNTVQIAVITHTTQLLHFWGRSKLCTVNVTVIFHTWWRHQMGTFSALLALCAGNSPVNGEFPSQRPVTRNFEVFFDLRRNKRLGWWFETPSRPSWRHFNEYLIKLYVPNKFAVTFVEAVDVCCRKTQDV